MIRMFVLGLFLVMGGTCMSCYNDGANASKSPIESSMQKSWPGDIGPDAAAEQVAELYRLISKDPVNVINIGAQDGFYRITFEVLAAQRVEQTVYVSRDGKHLSESLTDLPAKAKALGAERSLLECLSSKGVRVFVSASNEASLAQVTALGRFHHLVTVDCSVGAELCARHGVTEYPMIKEGERLTRGPKPLAWFEALTLCK